ncbi:sugar transporter [Photobacterium jeanii]|uniref:Sugar transporter n=1 Tax=Photobacterium jeanii TaxID=858640 RepID=A0A178KJC1_9GAMM|nr:sugar transporter [Photobacterium jeanii]OAN16814.1 sugar transporter [Photobacterium jeanii]PST88423.1 sugar transporter [Photobacterium jeanii]
MRHKVFAQLYPLLLALWKHRYLVIIPMLVMPILMTTGSMLKAKRYYGYTTILVQESAMLNPFLEDLSIAVNLKQRIKALRVLIQSKSILDQVIIQAELAAADDPVNVSHYCQLLKQNLKLELVGNDVVQLGLTWHKPEQIPLLLNTVSNVFLEKLRAPGRASVDSSETFLQQQLQVTRQELEAAENALADFKTRNADNLPHLQGTNIQTNAQLNTLIRETELALLHAQSQRDNLYQRLASTNPVVGMMEEAIVKAEAELAILRASYTDRHSSIKALLLRLNRLKTERGKLLEQQQSLTSQEISQLWQRVANQSHTSDSKSQPILLSQFEKLQQAENQIAALNEELKLLHQQAQEMNAKRTEYAELEQQLATLQRNHEVKARIYNQLFERFEMAKVTGQLGRFEEPDKLKIIDYPSTPNKPLNWPWWINFCVGIVAGLGLGLSLACVVQLLDTRLYQSAHIHRLTKVPILIRVPHFSESQQ